MGPHQDGGGPLRVLILVTCRWLNATAEGAVLQARAIASAGHEVAVAGTRGSPSVEEASKQGFQVFGLALGGTHFASGLACLAGVARAFRPDVICTHRSEDQAAAALLRTSSRLVRIRSDIRRPVRNRLSRWIDRRTDLVAAASPFLLRDGYLAGRTGPIACIPIPVDTKRFVPAATRPPRTLVSAGRLSEVKGHRTLLRALAAIPGARAVIAGEPAQLGIHDLNEYACRLGVDGRVEFAGRLSDMPAFYSRGALGVVCSLGSEAVSRAAGEMMASGLPVLAAATNGLVDLVKDGETGLLHPPGDWETLAAQALHLLDNPSAAAYLSGNGRCFCETDLSIEAVGRLWESALMSLQEGNKAGS
jgi:glycosyltransferase involved in cell wall biosynthesis